MATKQKTEAKEAKKLGKRLSVIGHDEILNYLEKSISSSRLAHAYIFLGPEDVGKETVARWWLEKILHQGSKGGERHSLETHPDVAVIERIRDEKTKKLKKLISIEQIRDLNEKISLTSFLNSYKVALIREADNLSIEASNALLKTLEEPSGKTIIVLLVKDIGRLPATIASRCQIVKFRIIPEKLIYDELINRGATREEAELLSRLSAGSPGVALKFFEDNERLEEYKSEVKEFLEVTSSAIWKRFNFVDTKISTRGDREEIVHDVRKLLSIWQGVIRDALLYRLDNRELMVNYWAVDEISRWSGTCQVERMVKLLNKIKQTEKEISQNANIRLAIENFLLNF